MMVTANLRANASHHVVHTYMSLKNSCLKASFALGVTEIGCMAHARRKFYELHATKKSILAEQALQYIAAIYEVEREVRDLESDERRRIR